MNICNRVILSLAVLAEISSAGPPPDEKIEEMFYQMAVTRSWHYSMQNIKGIAPEAKAEAELGAVAFAFRYWVLVQRGILERNTAFERQLKDSFSEGTLSARRLDDPLGTFEPDLPHMALPGTPLKDDEYRELSKSFKNFVLSK